MDINCYAAEIDFDISGSSATASTAFSANDDTHASLCALMWARNRQAATEDDVIRVRVRRYVIAEPEPDGTIPTSMSGSPIYNWDASVTPMEHEIARLSSRRRPKREHMKPKKPAGGILVIQGFVANKSIISMLESRGLRVDRLMWVIGRVNGIRVQIDAEMRKEGDIPLNHPVDEEDLDMVLRVRWDGGDVDEYIPSSGEFDYAAIASAIEKRIRGVVKP